MFLGCLLPAACIAGSGRGYPLFPMDGPPPDPSTVARLVGYIRYVDGHDVSGHGGSFELLPGCHLVVTPSNWGRGDINSGAVVATTGAVPFVLPMKAGFQYSIEVLIGSVTGPNGSLEIKAFEKTMAGEPARTFSPAKTTGDLEACREQLENENAEASDAGAAAVAVAPSPPPPAVETPAPAPSVDEPALSLAGPPSKTSHASLDEAMTDWKSLVDHWRPRLTDYRPQEHPPTAAQAGTTGVDFNRYLNSMQGRLQLILSDCSSQAWKSALAGHAGQLQLEVAIDPSGAVKDEGVVASSGSSLLDAAALEAIVRGAPYGATPPSIRSPDGVVYLRWQLSVDPTFGCTAASRPSFTM